jgi:hypothetical protein
MQANVDVGGYVSFWAAAMWWVDEVAMMEGRVWQGVQGRQRVSGWSQTQSVNAYISCGWHEKYV